eukprot:scaffold462_cov195-Pinguiococcus_pyrenoidosus.AAC.38
MKHVIKNTNTGIIRGFQEFLKAATMTRVPTAFCDSFKMRRTRRIFRSESIELRMGWPLEASDLPSQNAPSPKTKRTTKGTMARQSAMFKGSRKNGCWT